MCGWSVVVLTNKTNKILTLNARHQQRDDVGPVFGQHTKRRRVNDTVDVGSHDGQRRFEQMVAAEDTFHHKCRKRKK